MSADGLLASEDTDNKPLTQKNLKKAIIRADIARSENRSSPFSVSGIFVLSA